MWILGLKGLRGFRRAYKWRGLYIRNRKSASKQAIVVLFKIIIFCIYCSLIKPQKVIIDQIHFNTSKRGSYIWGAYNRTCTGSWVCSWEGL